MHSSLLKPSVPSPTTDASLSRRRFLHASLASAVAAPLIPSPHSLAAESPFAAQPKFERKIKLGVVGCGGRGAWIAGLFQRHGGYEVWAVADYFQPVADACGDRLGVDQARRFSGLSGYRPLIESGIEAIALETPPYFFPEHARHAIDAGLHVYMAKPVAVDVWGCLDIQNTARKATAAKHVFWVDYQLPTDPHNVQVAKMIREGEVGPLVAVNSHYYAGLFPDPPRTARLDSRFRSLTWCNDVALGGGYHVNACIHAVDAALWLIGQRPVSATGLSRVGRAEPHGDSHDVFQLVFEYENGVIHSHRGKHLNNLTGFDVICQAQGQSGFAQVTYGGKTALQGKENSYQGEVQNLYEAGAVRNIAGFYDAVVAGHCENETVPRSVDGALACILGREAGRRRARLTWEQLLKENQRLEVDLSGL